jgi:hypothetical protein
MLCQDLLTDPGHLKSRSHPHYLHCPSCINYGQRFWGSVIVDLFGYPGAGICPMCRVVGFDLLLDDGDAGESACFDWPGVGQGMGYVYGTVTPSSRRVAFGGVVMVRSTVSVHSTNKQQ